MVPGAGHAAQLEDRRRADAYEIASDRGGRRGCPPVRIAFFVGLGVVVAVEVLLEEVVERGAVAHDRVGGVLVAVFGVLDEIGFGELEALAFALAGFDEWCERGIDLVVRRLRPFRCHARTLRHANPGTEGTAIDPPRGSGAPVRLGEVRERRQPARRALMRRAAAVCTPAAIPSGPSKVDAR